MTSSITGSQSAITVNGGALDHFVVAGFPDPTTAGVSHTFTVTAKDGSNNTLTGYTGTVTLDSTNSQAVFPASPYHFTGGDAGTHTFNGTLKTAGTWAISATDGGISDSQTGITVNPAAANDLVVSSAYPSSTVAGDPHPITIKAVDAFGNTATGYAGTVRITSSDVAAGLPANHAYTGSDAGIHTFSVTLKTPGSKSITATDVGNSALTDTQSGISVSAGAAISLAVAGYPTRSV